MAALKECCVLGAAASFDKDDQCLRTELEAAVERVIDNPVDRSLSSAVSGDWFIS
jgi:hypothetical protein